MPRPQSLAPGGLVKKQRSGEVSGEVQQRKKSRKRNEVNSEDERDLEKIVLGTESDLLENLNEATENKDSQSLSESSESESDSDVEQEEENLQTRDWAKSIGLKEGKSPEKDSRKSAKKVIEIIDNDKSSKRVAWEDDDDNIDVNEGLKNATKRPRKVGPNQKYKEYLESKFTSLHTTPKWALDTKARKAKTSDDEDDDDDELFQTAGDYVVKSKKLPKSFLSIKKCVHLNAEKKFTDIVNCVQFHRTTPIGLVSTVNSVNLFQVDGEINAKMQSFKFDNFEIGRVRFAVNDEQLIVGSKMTGNPNRSAGFFYSVDLMSGKILTHPFTNGKTKLALDRFALSSDGEYIACKGRQGLIHILHADTKENLYDLKMNGDVVSLAFSSDSNKLYTLGNEGRVFLWDLRSRGCVNKFVDQGSLTGTALALSPNGQFLATGSDVGVVNIFKTADVQSQAEPKPVKALMNLTTEVTSLKFNLTSELLVMASSFKENAIRCVHVPSTSVFSNFPMVGQTLKYVSEVDISPNSGYLAFGNNRGIVNLQRLCHYSDY